MYATSRLRGDCRACGGRLTCNDIVAIMRACGARDCGHQQSLAACSACCYDARGRAAGSPCLRQDTRAHLVSRRDDIIRNSIIRHACKNRAMLAGGGFAPSNTPNGVAARAGAAFHHLWRGGRHVSGGATPPLPPQGTDTEAGLSRSAIVCGRVAYCNIWSSYRHGEKPRDVSGRMGGGKINTSKHIRLFKRRL